MILEPAETFVAIYPFSVVDLSSDKRYKLPSAAVITGQRETREMTISNKAYFKTVDAMVGPLEEMMAEFQTEIDELEDKQSGSRATDARAEKIDALTEVRDLIDAATVALEELAAQLNPENA